MKIQIIGFSGSGKSTLTRTLSKHYEIPALHLDAVHFYGDWQERTVEEQTDIVRQFMKENPSWIIDGNYSMVARERFEESDLTIFLAYNRLTCYFNCRNRYKKHKGTHREDCPCEEKFDFEFRKWILWTGRKRKRVQNMHVNLNRTSGEKVVLKNQRQLQKWLKEKGIQS